MTIELGAAFLLGLLGSAHCAGMCGPIALALAGGGEPRARFLLTRSLYNAGRVLTYVALGLLVGLLGHALRLAGWQQGLSIAAGVALLLGAIFYLRGAPGWWHPPAALTRGFARLQGVWGRLMARRSAGGLFGLGLLNGLLPCGLVYAALAGAAATGSAAGGAAFMLVFGLGTFPAMLAISVFGHALAPALRRRLNALIPAGLALMAGLLILRGLGLGIPYLSPAYDATTGAAACCPHEIP